MAAYVQLICLTIVSINTSLDPGGPSQAPAWQLALPLFSLRRTVRDVFEAAMMIGRPNDQVPLPSRKDAGDSPRQPESNVAIKTLNLAAGLACYISLQDQESNAMHMKLLVANTMCCWITCKLNNTIRRRRRDIDQDPLPRQSKLAIDIATTFISHSTLLMLMTSESSPKHSRFKHSALPSGSSPLPPPPSFYPSSQTPIKEEQMHHPRSLPASCGCKCAAG
jgi:hypothetical protein